MEKPDLSKPSVAGLAYILRHKEEWPEDFHWDFNSHRTCALGLMDRKWVHTKSWVLSSFDAAHILHISGRKAFHIFIGLNKDGTEVLPEDIAARLEAINVNDN